MVEILIGILSGTISGTGMGGGTILIFLLSKFLNNKEMSPLYLMMTSHVLSI